MVTNDIKQRLLVPRLKRRTMNKKTKNQLDISHDFCFRFSPPPSSHPAKYTEHNGITDKNYRIS